MWKVCAEFWVTVVKEVKTMKIVLIFTFLLIKEVTSSCKIDVNVDISDGNVLENGTVIHNGIYYSKEHIFTENGTTKGCICEYKTCIRKCCQQNEHYLNDSQICDDYNSTFKTQVHQGVEEIAHDTYHIIHVPETEWCKDVMYKLEPELDNFKIQKEGHLFLPGDSMTIDALKFCVEHFGEADHVAVVGCEKEDEPEIEFAIHSTGL